MATNKIREEEVKNIIRQEFFQDYDATPILGACKWLKFTSAQDRFYTRFLLAIEDARIT